MIQYFNFCNAAGIVVDSPFSVRPIQFPTTSGSVIFTADPVYCLYSPQTLDLVSNTYDISLRGYSDNHFYIQTSGSVNETASYNLVSGSQITTSLSTVLFDWKNIIGISTEGIVVTIKPVLKNISWQDSLILSDQLPPYTTDINGEFTASLIQTIYKVDYRGPIKSTPLYLSISGSSATASQCIIDEPYKSNKVVIPKPNLPYGPLPITSSTLYTPLQQTYLQTQNFQFADCTGNIISQSFQIIPMQPPWVSGSIIFSSDPLPFTSSTDPVSVLMATGLYKVELNKRASSDFWISLSGSVSSIAASNIISGSYQVANYCQVLFDLKDFECNPLEAVLTVKPIYVNVGINNTFLVEDAVPITITNGSKTIQLAPQPYNITIHSTGVGYGRKDSGPYQIYPVLDCTASQILVQGYNKNKIGQWPYHVPLPFSVDFSASYGVNSLESVHSIYADSASYVPNLYPQIFDGSRAIKTLAYVGEIPGSTTISEWLNSVFYADILGTISINSGTTYYEIGSAPTITINGGLNLNDSIIAGTGSVWRDGIEWYQFSGTSYSTTDIDIVTDHTYQTFYQLDTGVIASAVKTVDLIFPFLYGVSSTSGLSGTALYNALTLDVTPQANKTYTVSGTETYLYVAYPATMPDMTDAYDPNLFHILSTFDKSTISVTSAGLATNWTANCKVYQWKMLADFSGNYQIVF